MPQNQVNRTGIFVPSFLSCSDKLLTKLVQQRPSLVNVFHRLLKIGLF